MTQFEVFIVCALCVYRIAVMFSKERGPAGIFKKIRDIPDPEKNEVLYDGLRCMWCCSVWFAAIVVAWLVYLHWLGWQFAPIYWLALSGLAIVIDQIASGIAAKK